MHIDAKLVHVVQSVVILKVAEAICPRIIFNPMRHVLFACESCRLVKTTTASIPLLKYFIPACFGRGADLDLRVPPALAVQGGAGGVWKSWICPIGIGLNKQSFQTAWDITSHKFQGLGLALKAFVQAFEDIDLQLFQEIMTEAGWVT